MLPIDGANGTIRSRTAWMGGWANTVNSAGDIRELELLVGGIAVGDDDGRVARAASMESVEWGVLKQRFSSRF